MTVPGGEGLSIKGITINPEGESVTIALLNQITIACNLTLAGLEVAALPFVSSQQM